MQKIFGFRNKKLTNFTKGNSTPTSCADHAIERAFNQEDLIMLRKKNGVDKLLPGITGWAQVNGRDELTIPEKVKLDVEYMHKKSFLFDLKILWMTFLKVINRKDVSH